ncbi:carboxypeptidase regulatory-like domain-containing protein [Sulfurovum sp. XTW-4]|uniref:Carboxypeptidase regulatory-like domain-containing protein n=1 Tax=Sulfurovum xiamenensis TaxID=3019066 RepID=A0ABT7QQ00_9BACT|nr:carboxypeptidase regulatory-like domain-containing protein [Sulfurovum xiamenensis]MDM5263185.1 carboxypeptidase regulatory-like domain-containing protein [Sulfurovum xiamenensis]
MKKLVQLLLLMILPLAVVASELKEGTLSVLLFSEGKPLPNNEIKVDGKKVFKTDKDGVVKIALIAGRHQIEIFGKNTAGENLGYFKKPVSIKEGRDTEMIATLSKSGADSIDIDMPVAVAKSLERKEEKVTGEGTLRGQVVSSEGNTPISGARVFVRGTAVDVRTDANGRFSAKVPSGKTLSISVVHSAYSAQTIGGIVVKKDGTTSRTVKLTPASMELEEFVVLAPKIEGSIEDIMAEEKNINAVANILGSEELSKKGDSDAAAALKRVTGVTLVDGRNIYVRGLGERYSNVELNSLPLPSPNPLKRTVPLDIFPSSVIGSMKVQKSASADIPSSFGGGYIDIRTKEKFDEDFIKISLEGKLNNYTGEATVDSLGSGSDWTGYDYSFRSIPQAILDATEVKVGERTPTFTTRDFTPEELSAYTRMYINRFYNVYESTLLPGFGGSIEGAKKFDINEDHHLTIYGNYSYSQDRVYRPEEFFGYDYDADGNQIPEPTKYGTIDQTTMDISHGGMLNIGYNYLDVLTLKYTKLYTNNAVKTTRVTDGIIGSNYSHMTYYNLNWEQREMNVDQISGDFDYKLLDMDSNFNFGLQRSTAEFYQPNNYQYIYITEGDVTFNDNTQSNHLANRVTSDDTLDALYLKNKHEIEIFNPDEYIEYGINISSKERISRQRKYYLDKTNNLAVTDRELFSDIDTIYSNYVIPDYPYDYRLFQIATLFKAEDSFNGYVDETSPYISWMSRPREDVEMVWGLRYVNLEQKIDQFKLDKSNPDFSQRNNVILVPQTLKVDDYFPSLSIKYKHDDNNIFDLAASKTYIMPDMREFTEGEYFHPFDVATIVGNTELVNTIIYNFDLKYSHFFSENENVKLGLFYKYMDKPIEDVMRPSTSLPIYSFDNTDSATLYGFEIDGRKNLDFINPKWSNYYFSGNFSYNYSEVSLTEEQKETFTSDTRDLQGLSPYVVNFTFGYENDNRSALLNLNHMAERIRKVGVIDGPNKELDQYEAPATLLDFVWIEKFNYGYDFETRLKAGNLLDEEVVWRQGDGITRKFKNGRTLSLKISAKF